MSEWQTNTIDELKADKKHALAMGPFGSNIKADNFVKEGVPVIKGGNLTGPFLVEEKFDYLTEDKANDLIASNAYRGDIVITHRGTIGQVGLIPANSKYERYVVSQSQLKLSLDTDKVNPYFVYYYLRSPHGQHALLTNSSQVGVPAIAQALTSVRKIKVPYPDKAIQDEIVNVILTLDNKIELNQRINETLEGMARAIFKSWFVDFDPVHAKAEGREPEGMNTETAALFPSTFTPDGLPDGWGAGKLEDILELAYGKALKRTDRIDGQYPVYGSGGVNGTHNQFLVKGPGIIVGRKGTVGSIYWENKNFFPIDTVFYVVSKDEFSLDYIYYLLETLGLETMNTDAAVPGLNRNNAYRLNVAIPASKVVKAYTEIIGAFNEQISANLRQIETLGSLRDTLLPKLISGELRVDEADNQIREAVG